MTPGYSISSSASSSSAATKVPQAALYVGDLAADAGEADLSAAFHGCGVGPASARVCRDRITGRSLRYAYLNFASFIEAANAMRTMNHFILKGKPLRIMWSVRDPLSRKTGVGNLFVKNLEENIGGAELEELFKEYGPVISCKVAMDENGESKGFGFVQMSCEESAASAMAALHGKILSGGTKTLYVSNFVKKTQRQGLLPQGQNYTNLFVKNLEPDCTDDLLQAKFSKFGTVLNAVIVKNELGESRGFGFVTFELWEDALKAMAALNRSVLGSKTIYVGFAEKKAEGEEKLKQDSNVYVKHLHHSIDDRALRAFFSQCGEVISAKVMQELNGMSKGFGFVSFSSSEAARSAVATLHGAFFLGKSLYVAIAERKEERQKKLQELFAKRIPWPQPTAYTLPQPTSSFGYPTPILGPFLMSPPFQGYRYSSPVSPVPFYTPQQWASSPQYAPFAPPQLQHSVGTLRSIWSVQPARSDQNMSFGSHTNNEAKNNAFPQTIPSRQEKIQYPGKLLKRKTDELMIKEAVRLASSIKVDPAALHA